MNNLSRDASAIISEIKMMQTTFSGCFLLLEGGSDCKFFRPRIDKQCHAVSCDSKSTAIQSMRRIQRQQPNLEVIAVVDDDFDSLLGINHHCNNLYSTDTHDLETLMLSSDALNKILHEYADMGKVQALEKHVGKSFSDCLLERALPFGKLRYINAQQQLNINFSQHFSPWKFVDKDTWVLDLDALLEQFCNLSNKSIAQLTQEYQSTPIYPAWNMVQGHDVVAILSIAFQQVIKDKETLNDTKLGGALRLAFDGQLFGKTHLHASIKNWESHHVFKVLR